MKNITKRFPGVLAVDDVGLELQKGEVLALVGENGAGKSTLVKILSGVYEADNGEIIYGGKKLGRYTPRQAIAQGISIMYQELNYMDELSIAENIFVGNLPVRKGGLIDYSKLNREATEYMDIIGLDYAPSVKVNQLNVGEKQMVEIAKVLSKDTKVLIMDEPTAVLNDEEISKLFSIIKRLSADGISIIYISHRLDEIFEISDNVMVMRDGKLIKTLKTSETDKDEIVKLMVGREIKDMYPMNRREQGDVIMEVKGLSTLPEQNVSFDLHHGEILGLFGLMGSGRTRIIEAIFGKEKCVYEYIKVDGQPVQVYTPRHAINAGMGYVPSERKLQGLILIHNVRVNITIAVLKLFMKLRIFINHKKEAQTAEQWVDRMNIRTPSISTIMESLSGGNQQKVVLAKWMLTNPKVMLMNEPTRGIDVGAKVEVYKLMEEFCDAGMGILLISSELPEIMAIADRVITIHNGNITGEFSRDEFSQEQLLKAAFGE